LSLSSTELGGPPLALVVCAEPLARVSELCLRHVGCATETVRSVGPALPLLDSSRAAVFIIDVGLDGGMELLAAAATHAPALALIRSRGSVPSIAAFAAGADQVITVPFTPDELAIRTFALLRRFGGAPRLHRSEHLGRVCLSIDETLQVDGAPADRIDPTLNSLLYLLAANAGSPVGVAEIRTLVWGFTPETTEEAIGRRIDELRVLLVSAEQTIDTVAEGYIHRSN
jgi:DNA-binding response OmpR family regulator